MRRSLLAAVTLALASLSVAPAFADETDFKTAAGVKRFWQIIGETRR